MRGFCIILAALVAALSSCSFEKRLYRRGYYISSSRQTHAAASPSGKNNATVPAAPVTEMANTATAAREAAEPFTPADRSRSIVSTRHLLPEKGEAALYKTFEKNRLLRSVHRRWLKAGTDQAIVHEDIRTAFTVGLIFLFIIAPLTLLVLLSWQTMLESSLDEGWFLFLMPLLTIGFMFFAPQLIRDCLRAMRADKGNRKAQVKGTLGIIFCVLAALCGIGAFYLILLQPEVLLLIGISLLLFLLYMLISV